MNFDDERLPVSFAKDNRSGSSIRLDEFPFSKKAIRNRIKMIGPEFKLFIVYSLEPDGPLISGAHIHTTPGDDRLIVHSITKKENGWICLPKKDDKYVYELIIRKATLPRSLLNSGPNALIYHPAPSLSDRLKSSAVKPN